MFQLSIRIFNFDYIIVRILYVSVLNESKSQLIDKVFGDTNNSMYYIQQIGV